MFQVRISMAVQPSKSGFRWWGCHLKSNEDAPLATRFDFRCLRVNSRCFFGIWNRIWPWKHTHQMYFEIVMLINAMKNVIPNYHYLFLNFSYTLSHHDSLLIIQFSLTHSTYHYKGNHCGSWLSSSCTHKICCICLSCTCILALSSLDLRHQC